MKNKKLSLALWALLGGLSSCTQEQGDGEKQLSDYVNPFIGASTSISEAGAYHGLGKTIPGTTTPFGMVQLSPNTITGGDNGSGYSHEHTTIEGFAFTQMSGVGWYGDLGNFLVMPTVGPLHTNSGKEADPDAGYRSRYDKQSEVARAGYYSVYLSDYQVKAEATAAPHSGILRFTYPESKQSRIQIDLARRVGGTSTWQKVRVVDDHTIAGRMECTPEGGGWGNGDGKAFYTVYFYAQFSKPLSNYGVWTVSIPDGQSRKRQEIESEAFQQLTAGAEVLTGLSEYEGKHLGFFTEFDTQAGEAVLLKAGISFVSEEGAEKNLKAEIEGWDFDRILADSRTRWDDTLAKIQVEGGDDDTKTVFYTALYHTMLDPRMYTDVDGKYVGGDYKVHETDLFHKRTIFSGWDVFRSEMPLLTIIRPDVVSDMLNSLITMADENGSEYLERWEFLNANSGCMLGNPAISVLADAYAKGIRSYDIEKAYRYAVNTSEKFGNGERGFTPGGDGISRTLEHAYTEWCMAQLAGWLGHQDDRDTYLRRSSSYKNIYDPEVKSFRPRKEDGSFYPWPETGRLTEGYGCAESNPYQQGWFVPHDIEGMTELMGGRERVLADLDTMFANTPSHFLWNDYYNHANEPVHHIPYLYNRLGQPWKTQKWTRFICANAYKNKVAGLTGNEDVGQMSAWYVLSAMGLYQVEPCGGRYQFGSPVINKASFKTVSGKPFTIVAHNNSADNIYIKKVKLNGKNYKKTYIDYTDIVNGGTLEFFMGK